MGSTAGPRADPLIGREVGNYRVRRKLGQGGMGAVYLAEHPRLGRQVAIKVLARGLSDDPQLAARFGAEARAVTLIGHPNVIEVFDFGELDDGRLYYSMELLSGCELTDVIANEGQMTPRQVLPYLEQICRGLQAAHDAGVVHRDLKPDNIFVLDREPLALKLLDFGIARLDETSPGLARTSTGMVMGTPLYIAPEQAAGEPDRIGHQTDLYSLGVILFWMLAGRPPFSASVAALLLAKHISEPAPSLADFAPRTPDTIVSLLARCLAKEPSARPASALAVLETFAAGVDDPPMESSGALAVTAPAETTGATEKTSSPEAPPSGSVSDATSPRQSTTMSGTASEVSLPPAVPRRAGIRLLPMLLVGTLVGLGVGIYLGFFGEPSSLSPPSPTAVSGAVVSVRGGSGASAIEAPRAIDAGDARDEHDGSGADVRPESAMTPPKSVTKRSSITRPDKDKRDHRTRRRHRSRRRQRAQKGSKRPAPARPDEPKLSKKTKPPAEAKPPAKTPPRREVVGAGTRGLDEQ